MPRVLECSVYYCVILSPEYNDKACGSDKLLTSWKSGSSAGRWSQKVRGEGSDVVPKVTPP